MWFMYANNIDSSVSPVNTTLDSIVDNRISDNTAHRFTIIISISKMGRVNWARIFPFTCYPCGAFGYLIEGTIHGMAMKKPILILSLTVDYSDRIRFNLVEFFCEN